MSSVVDRFIRYVKIDTQSDHDSTSFPSTAKQMDLGRLLAQELKELGLSSVSMDQNGYVMASLPSNLDNSAPVIGFLAHMDTSPDAPGKDVSPQVIDSYDGGDIVLNAERHIVLSPSLFPELQNYTGQTLITTDGTTLLGADDKAGVAEIMAALEYLASHPQVKHGKICIGFTPDEETGHGVDFFDVEKFGADFAYTVDGTGLGCIEYETFNAAQAKVIVKGRSVHPGTAKDKMVNASMVAMKLDGLLPANERPEYTSGYEGFYHLIKLHGSVEEASLTYIIRDHDRKKFEERKKLITSAVAFLNERYGGCLSLELSDTYYNLREKIEPVMHIVDTARQAIEAVGLTPVTTPVRGGTDGSRLSFMGLPTPNLFTGGQNAHGPFEYIPVPSMEKSVQVILNIIELYAQ